MRYKFLWLIAFLTILISCSNDPTRIKQKDIIKKEKFMDILIDIHMMDAITNSPGYFRKYQYSDSLRLYDPIFEKHNVEQAEFDSTVSAYTRQPELYKEIYDEIMAKLNRRLDELKNLKEEIQNNADSLKSTP